MGEKEENPSKLQKTKRGEIQESERETPHSEEDSDCKPAGRGNNPSIKLKRRNKDRKVYEEIQRRGEKQNSTLTIGVRGDYKRSPTLIQKKGRLKRKRCRKAGEPSNRCGK